MGLDEENASMDGIQVTDLSDSSVLFFLIDRLEALD